MTKRLQRAAVFLALVPCIAAAKSGINQVTGIRYWSHADSTRVIVETSGPVDFKVDRAVNPDRLFFDVLRSQPWIERKRYASRVVNDRLVRRVRIAETAPGTTRIVFDLTSPGSFRVTKLEAPDRLVIEIRPPGAPEPPRPDFVSEMRAPARVVSAFRPPPPPQFMGKRAVVMASAAPLLSPAPLFSPVLPDFNRQLLSFKAPRVRLASVVSPAVIPPTIAPPSQPAAKPIVIPPPAAHPLSYEAPPRVLENSKASENASRSLTRALGLKVNRIVIDAGHGGHDEGTSGPTGVLEKDVVLDVALRLSKLVESRMGAEVILTRSDDTFIPLQERTAIANARKADLFLSIHANSSPAPSVAGTETFFLNFTNSAGALDVAARENSGAEKSVGELKDLIQSITLNDKITESQTFAQTVQNSLFAQAARGNVNAKNRGVKRAPFVVLIGASMPSILAEIGFLTNPRDEANLGKSEYRQKIAESLFKGLSQYSQSLSHFEMAGKGEKETAKSAVAGLN